MWHAEHMVNQLYRASHSQYVSSELSRLIQSPMTYTSELFDEEFLLNTRVKMPADSVPTPESQCCCYVFDERIGEVCRCRLATAPYNRFCTGHFRELRKDQHRLKKVIGPKALSTKRPEDLYAFALLRLMIIKKYFRPGGPCERALRGHIDAILKIGEEIVQIDMGDEFGDDEEEEATEAVRHLNVSSSRTPARTRPQIEAALQDVALLMTRIVQSVPMFDPVADIPEFSIEFLTCPIQRWHLFTCREESRYFDDEKKKSGIVVYMHAVSFLVIEYDAFVMLVCLNREERQVQAKSRAWGIYVPSIGRFKDLQIVSLSKDGLSVVGTHFTDVACIGSAFKFNKDAAGMSDYHTQISRLMEAYMQPQSMDRIVSRFPIEYVSGEGISVEVVEERPKYQNFGMPANRLPRLDWISKVLNKKQPIQAIGLSIEFWGIDTRLESRNWYPPQEYKYNHKESGKEWSKMCQVALDIHGASGQELLKLASAQ